MKEQIYTIPINRHFDERGGCPVCALQSMLEDESIDYSVGAAMMEPSVRKLMNEKGFCAGHYRAMLQRQKRLSLALTLESRLRHLIDSGTDSSCGCFICGRVFEFMEIMYANIVYLWCSSADFREKLDGAEHICLPHTAALEKSAKKNSGKKECAAITAALERKMKKSAEVLLEGVSAFCRSFDHRYSGTDLGDNKKAAETAITYLTGEVP